MGIHANNRDLRLARIYCDGVTAQKNGDLISTDPWPASSQESLAWLEGFNDATAAVADLSMCGYPDSGKESPELLEVRY